MDGVADRVRRGGDEQGVVRQGVRRRDDVLVPGALVIVLVVNGGAREVDCDAAFVPGFDNGEVDLLHARWGDHQRLAPGVAVVLGDRQVRQVLRPVPPHQVDVVGGVRGHGEVRAGRADLVAHLNTRKVSTLHLLPRLAAVLGDADPRETAVSLRDEDATFAVSVAVTV